MSSLGDFLRPLPVSTNTYATLEIGNLRNSYDWNRDCGLYWGLFGMLTNIKQHADVSVPVRICAKIEGLHEQVNMDWRGAVWDSDTINFWHAEYERGTFLRREPKGFESDYIGYQLRKMGKIELRSISGTEYTMRKSLLVPVQRDTRLPRHLQLIVSN